MKTTFLTTGILIMTMYACGVPAARSEGPPRELGRVTWQRDFDQGLAAARSTGRPVLILFQEIPGCATCVGFGQGPLSNPLLVEAIEDEFVPVAIHNNKPGRDAEVLKTFGEPAWNNPVVRFLDASGKDLIPRRDGVWDDHGLADRMVQALKAAGRPVPNYLELAVQEANEARQSTVTFAMHCFWEGEAKLGGLEGVTSTRAGFLDGHEVVEVTYDSGLTDVAALTKQAKASCGASKVYSGVDRDVAAARTVLGDAAERNGTPARNAPDSDQKYYLARSPLKNVPLTPLQQARVNAAIAAGRDGMEWLSPRQRKMVAEAGRAGR